MNHRNNIDAMGKKRYFMNLTLKLDYPETIPDVLNESKDKFEQEAKMAMAVKLYELKRLSSGVAAKLAGLDRVTFLLKLADYGVSTVNITSDELHQDVSNA